MKIFLVGFMGSGKSLLGKRLAAGLGFDFYDLDALIEAGEGMAIPAIFAEKGEQYFRALEAKYLRDTASIARAVIATGGGTPCFSENMDWMNEAGITLHLDAPVETLVKRLQDETSGRPLLKGKSDEELRTFVEGLLSKREKFYKAAKYVCKADLKIENLSDKLIGYFQRFVK